MLHSQSAKNKTHTHTHNTLKAPANVRIFTLLSVGDSLFPKCWPILPTETARNKQRMTINGMLYKDCVLLLIYASRSTSPVSVKLPPDTQGAINM